MKKGDFFSNPDFVQLLLDSARDAIIVENGYDRIVEANRQAVKLFGYGRAEILSIHASELEAPESRKRASHPIYKNPDSKKDTLFETLGLTKTGEKIPLEVSISSFLHEEERFYLLILRDITERKKAEEEIYRMANMDLLTGLPNRRYMYSRLEDEKVRSERSGRPFALIMSDIDGFKQFNDNFGHDCGDYVLSAVGRQLESSLRKQDAVSRWGGEEFLFLLPETNGEGAVKTAEKIREQVEKEVFRYSGMELHITMTFGVSTCVGNVSLQERIKRADTALLLGKNRGKNRVIYME